jgi:hypothetical protein
MKKIYIILTLISLLNASKLIMLIDDGTTANMYVPSQNKMLDSLDTTFKPSGYNSIKNIDNIEKKRYNPLTNEIKDFKVNILLKTDSFDMHNAYIYNSNQLNSYNLNTAYISLNEINNADLTKEEKFIFVLNQLLSIKFNNFKMMWNASINESYDQIIDDLNNAENILSTEDDFKQIFETSNIEKAQENLTKLKNIIILLSETSKNYESEVISFPFYEIKDEIYNNSNINNFFSSDGSTPIYSGWSQCSWWYNRWHYTYNYCNTNNAMTISEKGKSNKIGLDQIFGNIKGKIIDQAKKINIDENESNIKIKQYIEKLDWVTKLEVLYKKEMIINDISKLEYLNYKNVSNKEKLERVKKFINNKGIIAFSKKSIYNKYANKFRSVEANYYLKDFLTKETIVPQNNNTQEDINQDNEEEYVEQVNFNLNEISFPSFETESIQDNENVVYIIQNANDIFLSNQTREKNLENEDKTQFQKYLEKIRDDNFYQKVKTGAVSIYSLKKEDDKYKIDKFIKNVELNGDILLKVKESMMSTVSNETKAKNDIEIIKSIRDQSNLDENKKIELVILDSIIEINKRLMEEKNYTIDLINDEFKKIGTQDESSIKEISRDILNSNLIVRFQTDSKEITRTYIDDPENFKEEEINIVYENNYDYYTNDSIMNILYEKVLVLINNESINSLREKALLFPSTVKKERLSLKGSIEKSILDNRSIKPINNSDIMELTGTTYKNIIDNKLSTKSKIIKQVKYYEQDNNKIIICDNSEKLNQINGNNLNVLDEGCNSTDLSKIKELKIICTKGNITKTDLTEEECKDYLKPIPISIEEN